jgi:outer membrane lipoprotein carrier protein
LELKDNFGQTSVPNYSSFQRNPSLGAQQFKFEIPKCADVNKL